MDAREVFGIPADGELSICDFEKIYDRTTEIYKDLLTKLPEEKARLTQLIARAEAAYDALTWELAVKQQEPRGVHTGKLSYEKLLQMLADYQASSELKWLEDEMDKDFRNSLFHGKDRVLLMLNSFQLIEVCDISEHDIDGRIRQGYLAELRGDIDIARQIYDSVGFSRRLNDYDDDEGFLMDTEVEHYG